MLNKLKTYFRVWKIFANNALQETFVNRSTNILFILGKIIRLFMSLLFLFLIKQNIQNFANYTTDQLVVFFLTYQLLDLVAQIIYRGVYIFGSLIKSGEFDLLLTQPINPLFRALTGKTDINDFIMLFPNLFIAGYIINILNLNITWWSIIWYLILLVNAFLIITALHIFVLVIGIITTEVDGVIWIYRDLSYLGRFPITIYMEPIKFTLFFIVPIGMMITIPTEILLGLHPSYNLFVVFGVGIASLLISLKTWHWALKRYSSVGS